jgi:uncharacterized protein (UPF0332 family)
MKKEIQDLAIYRMEKAKRTLSDAKLYFGKVSLESTVNRIYYSLFYAVNALFICKGLSSSKHAGVRSIFNREFVGTGQISTKAGRFFAEMFDKRQKGDYADYVAFEMSDVEVWLIDADEFLTTIENLVQDIIKN